MGRRISRHRTREALTGFFFISPWMIGFAVFILGPMVASAVSSFCRYDPSSVRETFRWVGLANYLRMFRDDPIFWKSLGVTFKYSIISIPLQLRSRYAGRFRYTGDTQEQYIP